MDSLSVMESQAMFDDELPGKNVDSPDASDKERSKLLKIKGWWDYAKSIQAESRLECLTDHDFYDGDQWRDEDKLEIEARGQIATVFNRIKPTLDWLIGTEKRSRIDYRVLPRTKEDSHGAEFKTHLLKYLSDVNKIPSERSQAFKDAVISGLGWMESGITSEQGEEPIFVDYEDWRNIWFDPLSVRIDLKDCRFVIRRKRVDLDVACAMFPQKAGALRTSAISSNDRYGYYNGEDEDTDLEVQIEDQGTNSSFESSRNSRSRVELVECWYKTPETIKVFDHGTENVGTLRGTKFYPENESHKALVDGGYATIINAIRMTMRCMVFAGNIVLQDEESPYNHGRFPFVPIWGFRKKRNNTQYGAVRNLRDIQDDLNKRRSKSLFILSTKQVVADDDAVDDWELLADEVSRPDGIIKKKRGSELAINSDTNLAREHVEMMIQDAEYIESVGGVTDEQKGLETNAISGKAIMARQQQGGIVSSEFFDNLRVSTQLLGEILLSLIEQFYTDEKVFRISNDKNQSEFFSINSIDPGTGEVLNDITASQADFVVDSSAWTASIRQAAFETMMEMMTRMPPEIALSLMDIVVDLSDIPGKDDLVARIRMVNGMQDPDADQDDPEYQAAQAAQQQQQQAEAMFNETMKQLEIAEKQSVVNKNNMDAEATKEGMAYDREKLRIEKARALHDFQNKRDDKKQAENQPTTKTKDRVQATKQGVHGIRSDNQIKDGRE